MKSRLISVLMTIVFVVSIAAIVARAAPAKQKTFASKAAVVVSPELVTVPAMNGYDVIQNLSTETRDLSIAQNTFDVDTSTQARLSPAGDWRSQHSARNDQARSSPMLR